MRASERGYGSAIRAGIESARGAFVIIGDADLSYDFAEILPFVEKLRQGYDLVVGNRFRGGIDAGAMPWKHRYLGNPVLSAIGRLFFQAPLGDFHCGLRGLRRDAYARLGLRTAGMEFASEMVIKAAQMRIPFLVSRSGLTQMGYEIAQKVGMTMIGRATNKHYLVFTGGERFLA